MSKEDWTGVESQARKVSPLTAETFIERLNLLSSRAQDIRKLRAAMKASKEEK